MQEELKFTKYPRASFFCKPDCFSYGFFSTNKKPTLECAKTKAANQPNLEYLLNYIKAYKPASFGFKSTKREKQQQNILTAYERHVFNSTTETSINAFYTELLNTQSELLSEDWFKSKVLLEVVQTCIKEIKKLCNENKWKITQSEEMMPIKPRGQSQSNTNFGLPFASKELGSSHLKR